MLRMQHFVKIPLGHFQPGLVAAVGLEIDCQIGNHIDGYFPFPASHFTQRIKRPGLTIRKVFLTDRHILDVAAALR